LPPPWALALAVHWRHAQALALAVAAAALAAWLARSSVVRAAGFRRLGAAAAAAGAAAALRRLLHPGKPAAGARLPERALQRH
jgi:hypothetical protein